MTLNKKILKNRKYSYFLVLFALVFNSCVSKKEVLYFQDSKTNANENINYSNLLIQPNDILSIVVGAEIPESAISYNRQTSAQNINLNLEVIKLNGYLVSLDGHIQFPILGKINVVGRSVEDIEFLLQEKLEKDNHLIKPTVSVRLLNAKVTVLGEVRLPGTYSFTEQNISLLQALGYAGDLTINGKREDVKIIREINGVRTITHVDLTSTDWFKSEYYYVKPNDIIVVDPNTTKVKSAGFIGNSATILTIASLILSSIILISR